MSTTVSAPPAPTQTSPVAVTPGEQRVVLDNVAWETYVALCDADAHRHSLLAFDRGTLEIMSPSPRHEEASRAIHDMIRVWAEVFGIEIRTTGSFTCRFSPEKRGFEADESYYVSRADQIRGIAEFDMAVHPAPDLVVEVDISRTSMGKFDIYESLDVAEVWLFNGDTVSVFAADKAGKLRPVDSSVALAGFPVIEIPDVVRSFVAGESTATLVKFRERITSQRKAEQ